MLELSMTWEKLLSQLILVEDGKLLHVSYYTKHNAQYFLPNCSLVLEGLQNVVGIQRHSKRNVVEPKFGLTLFRSSSCLFYGRHHI